MKLRFYRLRRPVFLCNQKGQAIVELAFMMVFLAVILLAMIIIHELGMKSTIAIDSLRQEMRSSMRANAGAPFAGNRVKKDVFVNIPGKMKQVFGRPFIKVSHKIEFYEGSYQGSSMSKYNLRDLYRKIEIDN